MKKFVYFCIFQGVEKFAREQSKTIARSLVCERLRVIVSHSSLASAVCSIARERSFQTRERNHALAREGLSIFENTRERGSNRKNYFALSLLCFI